jgi:two-component system sensor histidine kinase RegB
MPPVADLSAAALALSRRGGDNGDPVGPNNMELLIQLRWIAVIGQAASIAVVDFVLGVPLPLPQMTTALACLVAFNLFSLMRWRDGRESSDGELFVALLFDVAVLTAQLYFSGGANNPFIFLYLLQVSLGGAMLPPRHTWALLLITTAASIALTLRYQPLPIAFIGNGGRLDPMFLLGMLICLVLEAVLLVIFVTRISRNQRDRDARLADLRQQAAEQEHIVRMGLLASGAAHELSTPLATLSVILGDWRHMAPFSDDPERLQEVEDMQTQVTRCKAIVNGILLSAGEARGVAPAHTTLAGFLAELTTDWLATRPGATLEFSNRVTPDIAILSDSALRQMIENILDNALEASPRWVGFTATRDDGSLVLAVADAGPGFTREMLRQVGKPYHSSKDRPGAGLGLFLALNVARTLGGTLSVDNRPQVGAIVRMILPLDAIAVEHEHDIVKPPVVARRG